MPMSIRRSRDAHRLAARREQRDHREQRHDGEILEQQDRDEALTLGRGGLAALLQNLHDDGGGGEREAHAGDEGDKRCEAEQKHADQRQEQAAERDLREAEAEDLAPQRPTASSAAFRAR